MNSIIALISIIFTFYDIVIKSENLYVNAKVYINSDSMYLF